MAQFRITYGVGGGYNDINEEVIEAGSLDEAIRIAYDSAEQVYESYGIFENQNDVSEIDSDEEYEAARLEDMESWIEYKAVEI